MKKTAVKIAYLKGLISNDSMDAATKKVFEGILDALEMLEEDVDGLNDKVIDLNDYVESVDDALTVLEGDEEEDDDFEFPFGTKAQEDSPFDGEDFEEIDDTECEENLHVVHAHPAMNLVVNGRTCTACKRLFMIDPTADPESECVCPFCGTKMYPDALVIDEIPVVTPEE